MDPSTQVEGSIFVSVHYETSMQTTVYEFHTVSVQFPRLVGNQSLAYLYMVTKNKDHVQQ